MTATIIPFPRQSPLDFHELPDYWTDADKGYYVHCTYDGWKTHEETFAYCDAMARVVRRDGESDSDFNLRRSFVSIKQLPKRKS